MLLLILSVFSAALTGDEANRNNEARVLVETIESLQQPIQDFRCEFEGTVQYKGKGAETQKLGDNGLSETFSGVFIWKRGGDTLNDSLHRRAADGRIARETLLVRISQQQAEFYHRLNDAPLGYTVLKNPKEINSWQPGCPGWIFLIDKIKRQLADETNELSVHDEEIEGRPLKVLDVALGFKSAPSLLIFRYWIDMRRNGHVVRLEGYVPGNVVASRLEIRLAPFKVGKDEVWMPISGETVGYAAVVEKKPVITREPTSIQKIHFVDGTVKFNQRPGPEVFTIKYKPGTPISANLRKLDYEFSQQEIGEKPTKVDAKKMVAEEVAKAEEQKTEMVVSSSSEKFAWTPWVALGLGTVVLVSSLALWIQRRRR
jgi:hypothetical protein